MNITDPTANCVPYKSTLRSVIWEICTPLIHIFKLRKAFWWREVSTLVRLTSLIPCMYMSCGSGQNLYLFWRGPSSYHFKHIPYLFASRRVFYLWLRVLSTLTKSLKPKGSTKSQPLICLLSTAPFPFIWSLCLWSFWHLEGVFFEVRVSQTIPITPVAHCSHTGLDGGKEPSCGSA